MKFRLNIAVLFGILSWFLSATSCQTQKKSSSNENSCEGAICTMMFAVVNVRVQDDAGQPVILDSTQTLDAGGRAVFRGQKNFNGSYTVLDDGYRKALAMRTESFTFAGYAGGQAVVQGLFTISADCCHVKRVAGPEVLILK